MKNIFVYGTLKRGFPNYSQERLGRFYMSRCKTVNCYLLVIADEYYVPVLLLDGKDMTAEQISGELYQVDQKTLSWLDQLEGIGQAKGYKRIEIEILTDRGEVKIAEAYMKDKKDLDTIHSILSTHYERDTRYILPALRNGN